MSTRRFRRARRGDPCPVCGRTASCSQAPSGARFCWGQASTVRGWRYIKTLDNGFSLFMPNIEAEGNGRAAYHEPRTRTAEPAIDPGQLAAMLDQRRAKQIDYQYLGDKLGIHHSGIARLGMSRVPAEGKRPGYWLLPERDDKGILIGLQRRFDDGKKLAVPGSRRGLVYDLAPDDREPMGNTVVVVEGYSDTAAALSVGMWAIGRPNNLGGATMLGPLLQFAVEHQDVRIVVMGENDEKESGLWPGKAGAEKVARSLASMLGVAVFVAFPPDKVKDLRCWVRRELPKYKSKSREERAVVGQRILDAIIASTTTVEPDGSAQRLPPLELPDVPTYSELVLDTIAVGVGGMPCPAHAVPLLQRRGNAHSFLAIMARCRRWSCVVCQHSRRTAWLTHLLLCFERASELFTLEIEPACWGAANKALRRLRAEYVRIRRVNAPDLVLASGAARDARQVALSEAADLAASGLLAIDQAQKKCVIASRGWALRQNARTKQDFVRRGQGPRNGFAVVADRLRRSGIEPNITNEDEIGRASWLFPPDWQDERIESALHRLQAPTHGTEKPSGFDEW